MFKIVCVGLHFVTSFSDFLFHVIGFSRPYYYVNDLHCILLKYRYEFINARLARLLKKSCSVTNKLLFLGIEISIPILSSVIPCVPLNNIYRAAPRYIRRDSEFSVR